METPDPKPVINRHAPKPVLARFFVVNAFTAANLLLGVLSILFTMTGFLKTGALLLLGSVIMDMLDGNLARRWRVTTEFGAQMDSLADMIAFTLSSALLAWYWLAAQLPPNVMTVACGFYVLTGAIRLARFNSSPPSSLFFQGVPTTVMAGIVATGFLLSPEFDAFWALGVFVSLGALMVTTLPYAKFAQFKRIPRLCWVLAAGALIVNAQIAVFVIELLYLVSGPVTWWRRRSASAALSA